MTSKPKVIEAAAIEDSTSVAASTGALGTGSGFESTVSGLKEGMTRATAGFADTQAKVKEGMEKAIRTAEEMVAFSQGNIEAVVKSGQIWAAGVQDLGKQIAANAQASFDETMSAFRALTSAKSLKDAFDLQANLARLTLEKTLAESGKLTDASVKLTEQALAPLSARFSLAIEKFAKTA
jgi:phasin family protein